MTPGFDDAGAVIRREAERAVAAIGAGEIRRTLLERTGRIDDGWWRHCRDQGWTAIGIPEEHGGVGLGLSEMCILAEAGGAAAMAVPLLESGYVAGQAILRCGDARLKEDWLPRIAGGEVAGTISIVDGSELLPARPTLAWSDGRVVGRRPAVTAAAVADYAILSVATGDGPGLALVDLRAAEVKRTALATFDNSRCTADLACDAAPAVLLAEGGGRAAMLLLLDMQAVITAHQQLGGARAMLAAARSHALQRRAFGQPIGAFQSIKHRIAEGYVLVELAQASADTAVAQADTPEFARAAMAARLLATDAYETVTRDAVQIHGGIGATWQADLHLHQRRARTLALELGPIMAWEDRLVDALCEERA